MASLGDQYQWRAARCRSFFSRRNSRTTRGRTERLLRLSGMGQTRRGPSARASSACPLIHDAPRLIDELVPCRTTMVDEIVVGFEDAVGEPVVAHELPD